MNVEIIVAIIGVLLSIGAAVVAIGRYFAQTQRRFETLHAEIRTLQEQARVLRTAASMLPPSTFPDIFTRLMEVSTEAANAVGAEIHSISVPVPPDSPTDLRIILSTDPEASKIVGREFPITKGIAGWVYKTQQPYFRNRAKDDPRHFDKIDKAAETRSGEGAILTMPLAAGGRCYGVIQFMKPSGGIFTEEDVAVAARWSPKLTRLLMELEQNPQEDIPSIARGNIMLTAVLFSDISNFSQVASSIRLDTAVALLNEYYTRLLSIAIGRGGKLQEYVGDGLFISFPLTTPAAMVRAAVTAAISMQEEYKKILYSWQQYGHPVSDANTHNIGIATGFVYSGLVGHPQNRQEKLIGPAVNLGAHLCKVARDHGGGIVICPQTAEIIKTDEFLLIPLKTSTPIGECYQLTKKE